MIKKSKTPPHFRERLVVELVHGGGVKAEVPTHMFEVVACGCEGNFGSDAMASQSGSSDFMFVHEAGNVV